MATVGQYASSPNPLVDNLGVAAASVTVTVLRVTAAGTEPAVLYTDGTGGTVASGHTVTSGADGNVSFFAAIGNYVLTWTNADGAGGQLPVSITAGVATNVDSVNVVAVGGATKTLQPVIDGIANDITLSANLTVTMPAAQRGAKCYCLIHTGAGSFTVAFTGVKWAGGTPPTITATASATDYFEFKSDGTNWYGTVIAQALA